MKEQRQFCGGEDRLSKIMLEELYIYVKNVNTEFTHFTKINPEYRPKCKILNYKISRK